MLIRSALFLSVSSLTALALATGTPAQAGTAGPLPLAPAQICTGSYGGKTVINNYTKTITNTFNKNITIKKPVTVNKNINIDKSFDFSKNIVINKPVTITKNIDLSKNINIEKNIEITKNVNIDVEAMATASASAAAASQAQAATIIRGGASYITVINRGGEFGQIEVVAPEVPCVTQWATVVKAIHAVCVDVRGREYAAVRMRKETWIDSSLEHEIYRCLEGSSLRVTIGDVHDTDKGIAGVFDGGDVFECRRGEALRHFKDGIVKCAPAEKVPDCTERENMRRYGIGTYFFSYATKVCVRTDYLAGGLEYEGEGYKGFYKELPPLPPPPPPPYEEFRPQRGENLSTPTGEIRLSGAFDGGVGEAQ